MIKTKFTVQKIIKVTWVTIVQKNPQIVKILHQISHINKILVFSYTLKYNWQLIDKLLLPYKFHASSIKENTRFQFACCEPLKSDICVFRYQLWLLLWRPQVFYRFINLYLMVWLTKYKNVWVKQYIYV